MKKLLILFFLVSINKIFAQPGVKAGANRNFVLVIHGGAGTILQKNMTPTKEKAYQAALTEALQKGYAVLEKGGTAMEAVETAVRSLEDCPLFNAGKGAVFTHEGKNELDAAIMDGSNRMAGSVAGVTTIKNPVTAARAVLQKSPHVMMTGKGAEKFAAEKGLEMVDPSYFYTEERWKVLLQVKAEDSAAMQLDHADTVKKTAVFYGDYFIAPDGSLTGKHGTVGAVALDKMGNLAAATSTGGMTNKKFGRVGDAPIIGAGTYADNSTCAISCTGWGEYFIRLVMAKTISDMMEFGKWSLAKAADEMVMKRLPALGGDGGLIAVDKKGNIAMPFCTEGMYRGYIRANEKPVVKIYKE